MPHDTRDKVVDFVNIWSEKAGIPVCGFVRMPGVCRSKFYGWRDRYGMANEHNAWIPRDSWLLPWERDAIVRFFYEHPLNGCRRLAFMMLDRDVAAVSPSSVYRVLKGAGLLGNRFVKPSKKGTGFDQPDAPHLYWHTDVCDINAGGTFCCLCTVLDGYSRLQPLSGREEAERVVAAYIRCCNEERLNSAIGHLAPADKLAGREKLIFAERDRKLEEARKRRAKARQSAA